MKIRLRDMKKHMLKMIFFNQNCCFLKIKQVAMTKSLAIKEDMENISLMEKEAEEVKKVKEVVGLHVTITTTKMSLVKKVKATIVSQSNATIVRNLATKKILLTKRKTCQICLRM